MARYTEPVCKLCRREGAKLFLKGVRCMTVKCSFDKRGYAPGQHGQARKTFSNYAIQLREKQKVKRIYGILEKQFRNYFKKAEQAKGVTGTKLLEFLERRLDNAVFRLLLATSRTQARQMLRHGWVSVNGKKVNIPSYIVKVGDVINLKVKSDKQKEYLNNLVELSKEREMPTWLSLDIKKLQGKVERFPQREDVGFPIREHLIVELYSK